MSFLDLVRKRRSCRKYISRPVPRETLLRCLEAVRSAPSACHSQPWTFIVVEDLLKKNELADRAFAGVHAINQFARAAPVLVVIVQEKSVWPARLGGFFKGIPYGLIDLGIAGEHFVLQAAEEGLGTCWLGWFHERAVRRVLGISKTKRVGAIISVGFYAEDELPSENRKALDQFSRFI